MQTHLFWNCFLLLMIALCAAKRDQQINYESHEPDTKFQVSKGNSNFERVKRDTHHKPGFFKTLFSVIGEQYSDTKNTFRKVNEMINDNFLPENALVTETTIASDSNSTTTKAPYKITRTEFNKIIRRNLRGLMRLFNIELQDALKQSKVTRKEYDKNVAKEVSKFL
ncbi:hypothetical protein ABEB36_004245 [Hypothenemus hampei]|uniref:Uncharacterized protein n=1 Tax=Hypothenemus hampei TaxID=57062 RepID=A0ABD1F2S3_HYPHA